MIPNSEQTVCAWTPRPVRIVTPRLPRRPKPAIDVMATVLESFYGQMACPAQLVERTRLSAEQVRRAIRNLVKRGDLIVVRAGRNGSVPGHYRPAQKGEAR